MIPVHIARSGISSSPDHRRHWRGMWMILSYILKNTESEHRQNASFVWRNFRAMLSEAGVEPDKSKVTAKQGMSRPKNIKRCVRSSGDDKLNHQIHSKLSFKNSCFKTNVSLSGLNIMSNNGHGWKPFKDQKYKELWWSYSTIALTWFSHQASTSSFEPVAESIPLSNMISKHIAAETK